MFSGKIRTFAVPAVLLVLLFISILVLAHTLIHSRSVQDLLIHRVSDIIGVDIHARSIDLNLFGGIGIVIRGFEAKSGKGNGHIAAERVRIILDAGDLIRGRLTPTSLHLVQPEVELFFGNDPGPLTDRNNLRTVSWISAFQSIAVENGHVVFRGRDFSLDALSFQANQLNPGRTAWNLRARGNIDCRGQAAPFHTHGIILSPFGRGSSTTLDMMFETGNVPLSWVPWPESMAFTQGNFSARLKIEGDPKKITSISGKVGVDPFRFGLLHGNKSKQFSVPELTLDFQSTVKDRMLHVRFLQLKGKDLFFNMDFRLDPEADPGPYLELNARSGKIPVDMFKTVFPSPLLPSWLEDRLFPMLNDGDIRLKNLTIKGTTDRIRHLKKEENRTALEMDFECHDLEVRGGGIQVPFEKVSALVSLRRGDFRISGISGIFGHSEIRNAMLEFHGIFADSSSYEGELHGSFDLRELMKQKEIQYIPADLLEPLKPVQDLAGRMECGIRFGSMRGEYPRIRSGQLQLRNCTLIHRKILLPLKIQDAVVRFEEKQQDRFAGTGLWGNSAFRAEGVFSLNKSRIDVNRVDISADLDIGQAIPAMFGPDISPMSVKEKTAVTFSISRRNGHWILQGDMGLNRVVLESEDVRIDPQGNHCRIFFDLELNPRGMLRLKKILIQMNGSSMDLSGLYDFQGRFFPEMKFHTPGFSMEDLGLFFKKKDIQARGHVKGEMRLASQSGRPAGSGFRGKIEATDFCFPGLSPAVRGCELDMDISGKDLTIHRWKMHMGESVLVVSGKLRGWEGLRGDILVRSDLLDMADIPQTGFLKEEEADENVTNFMKRSEIGVRMEVKGGIWRHIKYGPLEAGLDLKAGDIYVNHLKANLEHGFLTLNGRIMRRHSPGLQLSGHVKLMDQPLHEIADGIKGLEGEMKGSLTMDALFMMEGNDKRDLVPGLTGSANILIEEGLIRRSRAVINVLDFLSLQNIFHARPPELRGEGFYFESMRGNVFMKKGVLRSEDFLIRSPVFNAVAYGEIDIPNKGVDFILGTQPHGTIDSLVSKIPLLGYIITGDKGSVLAYPFRVHGPISKPEVTFVPFETLGEGVGGVFKRLFLTPKRVIEELDRGRKKIMQKD